MWILDEHGDAKACKDVREWATWMESTLRTYCRIVAKDQVGNSEVSTVFLGLDHNFGGGEPILWETMIFGGEHDGYQDRYSSKDDAIIGHQKALELVAKRKFKLEEEV